MKKKFNSSIFYRCKFMITCSYTHAHAHIYIKPETVGTRIMVKMNSL